MILQLLGCVLLAEGSDFIKVHLKIMSHLLCKVIFWCPMSGDLQEHRLGLGSTVCGCKIWVGPTEQLTKECITSTLLTILDLLVCFTSLCNFVQHNLRLEHFSPQCVDINRLVDNWCEGSLG